MDRDRLAKAESIFQEALESPAAERPTLLDRHCGEDRELRAFVGRLLSHHDTGLGDFLEPAEPVAGSGDAESFPVPERIGRYEILRKIGEGGMGTVYEARDPALGRRVALKVLPARVASDRDRLLRFQREARAVAALNHPNIVTLHSVEEADGTHFLTMELVKGRKFSEIMAPTGLPLPEVLDAILPVTSAIAFAHGRGIVHRDLKPLNLMIDETGAPKVLDFSIAKILGTAEGTAAPSRPTGDADTLAGGVLGTIGYMSPEQLRAVVVDQRSDIFSLGIVLYEMVTGQRPFPGESSTEIAAAILRDPPEPATRLRPGLPARLDAILDRCLAKDREDRYASAQDMRDALEELRAARRRGLGATWRRVAIGLVLGAAVSAAVLLLRPERPGVPSATVGSEAEDRGRPGAGEPIRKRLAVLPFENLGEPEDGYFAAGITEEITSRLAEISGLSVVSRTSATRYSGTGKSVREIGEELGVAYVLEGSLRTERELDGTRTVRVTPQLIDVANDAHLWTDRYSVVVVPGEIFRVQADVAEHVAAALDVALLDRERRNVRATRTTDALAYDAYLVGLFHWNKRTGQALQLAARYFEEAIAHDPGFAQAHAGLAATYVLFPLYGLDTLPRREAYDRAERAARRALELDESLAEANTSLAVALFYGRWDTESAEPLFQRAVELDPDYAVARYWYGELLAATARMDEAIEQGRAAVAADPLLAVAHHLLGVWLIAADRVEEGEGRLLRAAELEPGFPFVHAELGDLYLRLGQGDRAVDEWERAGMPRDVAQLVAAASADSALRAPASAAVGALEASPEVPGSLGHIGFASLWALVGEPDRAFGRLEEAYREGSEQLTFLPVMALTDPGIARLALDPRFGDLMERVGLD